MLAARILMILVSLNCVARCTFAASEIDPKCSVILSQSICSTFYADRLSTCLEKMLDPNRITWDKANQKFCLTSNAKVCLLDKICKSSSAGSNPKDQDVSTGAPATTSPTTTLSSTTSPTTTLPTTTSPTTTSATTTTTTSSQVSQ